MQLKNTEHPFLITLLIIALGVVGMFASDIYVPSLPNISKELAATPEMIKLTVSFYLLGICVSPLLFGAWSDKYGRKPILLIFGIIGLLGTLTATFSINVNMLIAARMLQGFGFGITTALSRIVLVDLFEGKNLVKVSSYISFCITFAPALAPIIGSHLDHAFGWRAIFIFIASYLCISLILITLFVPETIKEKNKHAIKIKNQLKNYGTLISSKIFMGYTTCSSIAFASTIIFFSLSPFILQHQFHLSVIQYGWFTAAITAMVLFSRIVNVPLVHYFSSIQIIILGLSVMAISSVILLFTTLCHIENLWVLMFSMMAFILGTGVIFPNASSNALSAFRHIGGTTGALYASLQTFGAFIAGIIASVLPNSILMMSASFFILSMSGLLIFIKFNWTSVQLGQNNAQALQCSK